jgi:hypothetical protein
MSLFTVIQCYLVIGVIFFILMREVDPDFKNACFRDRVIFACLDIFIWPYAIGYVITENIKERRLAKSRRSRV